MKKLSKLIALVMVMVSILTASCFSAVHDSKAEEIEAAPVAEAVKAEEPAKVEEAPKAEEPVQAEEAPVAAESADAELTSEKVTNESETVEIEAIDEVTEEVSEETAEEITEEAAEETTEEATEDETVEEIQRSVSVIVRAAGELHLGDKVTLVSVLHGFDGCQVSYQWQVDKGNGFEDIKGANGSTYSFAADEKTLSYDYRVMVIAD